MILPVIVLVPLWPTTAGTLAFLLVSTPGLCTGFVVCSIKFLVLRGGVLRWFSLCFFRVLSCNECFGEIVQRFLSWLSGFCRCRITLREGSNSQWVGRSSKWISNCMSYSPSPSRSYEVSRSLLRLTFFFSKNEEMYQKPGLWNQTTTTKPLESLWMVRFVILKPATRTKNFLSPISPGFHFLKHMTTVGGIHLGLAESCDMARHKGHTSMSSSYLSYTLQREF